jgi:RNA polymerase sigma-70 factor (ECF subfamily)
LTGLVEAAKAGSEPAFAQLVERFAGPLIGHLVGRGWSESDAEDLAQDSFVKAWHHLASYDSRWAFSTWLFTIANRLAISQHRRQRPTVPTTGLELASDAHGPSIDEGPGPIWTLARQKLSERQYDVLWMRYGDDLDINDIASVLGLTAGNTKVILYRARTRLAALCTDTEWVPSPALARKGLS